MFIDKKIMNNFCDIINGLKNGQNFTRQSWGGKYFITMQIPADLPKEVIPNMQSLNDGAKAILSTIGDCMIHYRNQVLKVNMSDSCENVATYYQPTWEDIFAEDWMGV